MKIIPLRQEIFDRILTSFLMKKLSFNRAFCQLISTDKPLKSNFATKFKKKKCLWICTVIILKANFMHFWTNLWLEKLVALNRFSKVWWKLLYIWLQLVGENFACQTIWTVLRLRNQNFYIIYLEAYIRN